MKIHKVILGEFEDEVYAKIAKRELITFGIDAKVIKERVVNRSHATLGIERVRLIVNEKQIEEARKILTTRFI